jgi:hypothetical protein
VTAVASTLQDMLALSVVIALGFLLAVAFYESMSTRDVLVRRTTRLARRITHRRWARALVYAATVFVGIPLLVLLWTLALEIGLIFVGSIDRLGNVGVVAAAIVAAARILAYIREKTSHELAKAIPLALAFVLLTGGTLHVEENLTRILERPDDQSLTNEMVAFLLGLEIALRLLTDTSRTVLASIRERRGVESDLGVWRTLWVAVRRPITPVIQGNPTVEPDEVPG